MGKRTYPFDPPYEGRNTRARDLFYTGASYATGIPEPIIRAVGNTIYPTPSATTLGQRSSTNLPNLSMSNGQIAGGVRNSTTVIKGKKYKKSARIAKQIKLLSALHEIRMVQGQRLTTFHPGRQVYDILGFDTAAGNPTHGEHARGIMGIDDVLFIRNSIAGAAPAVGNLGYRFVINRAVATYNITNSTTGNIDIILYDFLPRKDVYDVANSNVFPATKAWYTGMTSTFQTSNITQAASTQFTDTDPSCYVNSTPFDSSLFCSYYKIIKKRKLCLSPGVCFSHKVVSVPRKVWDDNSLFDNSVANIAGSDIGYLGKTTLLTLIVIKGQSAHDSGGAHSDSTGLAAVDITTSKVYTYAYGPALVRSLNTSTDITTTPAGNMQAVAEATNAFITTAVL